MRNLITLLIIFSAACAFAASQGEDLFYGKCGSCHGTSLSLGKKKTESQWKDTVKRMEKHGLDISGSDTDKIAKFLAEHK